MASQDGIYEALRRAQLEFPRIEKTRVAKVEHRGGGAHTYQYADLADVIAAITPTLHKHNLCMVETFRLESLDGRLHVIHQLRLVWLGGGSTPQEILSEMIVAWGGSNAQDLGSWVSYVRRYHRLTLCGITAEDEDDDAALLPSMPPARAAAPTQGQAGGRVAPRSPASGPPARPVASVPRGTDPALLPSSWWTEPVGWGKTTIRGKGVKDMTWMEMVNGAHVDGGRMGWMLSQVPFVKENLASENPQYSAWARAKSPRLEAAIAHVTEAGLRRNPPEPPKESA